MPKHTTKKPTASQGNSPSLVKHAKKHSKPHIDEMKRQMKKGESFHGAHKKALKKAGK